ncbi:MAG TPA: Uma2 family endonuclease [Kofleriaceae bacterium]|nr:Uma2 family endonuclease [Kofleriaceae bacterium]
MAAPVRTKPATFADLVALGDDARAEIIHGALIEKAAPTPAHSDAQGLLAQVLVRRFRRGPGGRWPGGWWIMTEVDTEYEAHELFVHDLAGWRRDRVPERPSERPIRLRPDWACEILSPSNAKRDLVDKMHILHAAKVPHYWIIHPEDKVSTVYRWGETGYVVALTASSGETVRAEPFGEVELRVGVLFGDEDDDE